MAQAVDGIAGYVGVAEVEDVQQTELAQALAVLIETLVAQARERPELRRALSTLGALLTQAGAEPRSPPVEPGVTQTSAAAPPSPALLTESITLNLGGLQTAVRVAGTAADIEAARRAAAQIAPPLAIPIGEELPPLPDLPLIARRARLKSECCRWAMIKRSRLSGGDAYETSARPTDAEFIARAKELPQCFLWMLDQYRSLPADIALEELADTYENLAAAAELINEMVDATDEGDGSRGGAYALLAEAQSALRNGLLAIDVKLDQDQRDAFEWLKRRTFAEHVYLPRYMRTDDPADPAKAKQLGQKLDELRTAYEDARKRRRDRHRLIKKVRYDSKNIPKGPPRDVLSHWQTMAATLEELINAGVPPSDTGIRDVLLPIIDEMPEELACGPGLTRILTELDRYVATQESVHDQPAESRPRTQEITEAAELLRSRTVVLIGGERRSKAAELLVRSFELNGLEWLTAPPHASLTDFEPSIARGETAVVLLAIRWSSHSFGGVRAMCERYGKIFVRLPTGYNPTQVARQVLAQASEQLRRLPR